MNLLFDLLCTQEYGRVKYHGGGDYGKQIFIKLLERLNGQNDFGAVNLYVLYSSGLGIDKDVETALDRYRHAYTAVDVSGHNDVPAVLEEHGIDRYYAPVPNHLPGIPGIESVDGVTFIGTVHGLRQIEEPFDKNEIYFRVSVKDRIKFHVKMRLYSYFLQKETAVLKRIFELLDYNIITNSRHTKYAILSKFKEARKGNISYAHIMPRSIAAGREAEEDSAVLEEWKVSPKHYFLLVGSNRHEKNAVRVLEALSDYEVHVLDDFKFVFLGVDDELKKKIYRNFPELRDCIVCDSYISREKLESAYRNAFCLLYPSLSEGFGYPPLEVMKYGVPVIAAAVNALTEVYGDSVLYVNPLSPYEIANRINQITREPGLWEEYSGRSTAMYRNMVGKHEQELEKVLAYILKA